MKHSEILRVLHQFKGFPEVSDWQLGEIRKRAGLIYRRHIKVSLPEYDKAITLIHADLQSSLITQWG
jgi:hypothetical protein